MYPVLLVIDRTDVPPTDVAAVFAAAGWRVVGAAVDVWDAQAARPAGGEPVSLVLHAVPDDPRAAPALLRAVPAIGEAPLVARNEGSTPEGFDDRIDPAGKAAALRELAARWRPDDPNATLDRLRASIGAGEIDAMIARLRNHLAAAVAGLAAGGRPGEAHRIAGIAGMLGFAALGAAWLAVSHDTPGAEHAARIATRRALLALSRV